jgi:uncharacterized protein (TIGR01777 family)
MHILVTGKDSYLGLLVYQYFTQKGHDVQGINQELLYKGGDELRDTLANSDVIINLTGARIFQPWNDKNKAIIYDSRVLTSNNLVSAITSLMHEQQPKKVISISAVGIYQPNKIHTEDSKDFNPGFMGTVMRDWETIMDCVPKGIQTNIFRLGLVIGKQSKITKRLLLVFKLGFGSKIGSGKQAFPFVHEKDVLKAIDWAIDESIESNSFNLIAPERINNRQFTKTLAKKLKRIAWFKVPAWSIKLLFGEASIVLLEAPIVDSKRIIKRGFKFSYPDLSSSLNEILGKK